MAETNTIAIENKVMIVNSLDIVIIYAVILFQKVIKVLYL